MRQNLRLNLHGVIGILFVILMFGVAYYLSWNISWWYFVTAIVLYSGAIIFLTYVEQNIRGTASSTEEEAVLFRLILGCHLALLFLAAGLLLQFHSYAIPESLGGGALPAEFFRGCYFIAAVVGGLAIPFMVLRISQGENSINIHGVVGILLVILMFGIAFYYGWNISWWYFIAAIAIYTGAIVFLNFFEDFLVVGKAPELFRLRLGCHLAFIFLLVGFAFHFQNEGVNFGFFIASIAGGLVIPYLLFRGS